MKYSFFLAWLSFIGLSVADPAITIYNQGFAIVRQDVPIELTNRTSTVSFDEVTSQLEPDSVVLRDPRGEIDFQILEQNYRNDPVSQALLLEQFVGKTIEFELVSERGSVDRVRGKVIRSGYVRGGGAQTPIIETNGEIRFGLPGTPIFPSLGDDSILKPTLSWELLGEQSTTFNARLSYVSSGFRWKADYNLIVPEEGETGSLNGWVTLTNNSGAQFENTKVKLLAGDVNKTRDDVFLDEAGADPFALSAPRVKMKVPAVTQKELDSYHLYSVARPVTLRDRETKQVEFLVSTEVEAKKTYVYAPLKYQRYTGYRNTGRGQKSGYPKDVEIYWSFENSKENGLGVPMPAGKVRIYREDSDQQLEFLGDNTIDHTPQKETVEFYTGNAFDLVGERKMTNFKYNEREEWIKESVEIKVRNRSKDVATIEIREPLYRWSNWTIEDPSHEFTKTDAQNISYTVTLQPDEEQVITFTSKYFW